MRPRPNVPALWIAGAGLAPPLGGEPRERAKRRKLRRAEAHVARTRDAVAAFVWLAIPWLATRPTFATAPFLAFAVAGTIHTVLAHLAYRRDWGAPETRTLVTAIGDAGIVLALLALSGGWTSPLTPLLYVTMAAFAYRYELADGVAFGVGYGLAYVGVIAAVGDLGRDPVALVLRVGLLVATGMLASLSSKSFLEAEIERSRAEDVLDDVVETVPGEVALVPRRAVFGGEDPSPSGGDPVAVLLPEGTSQTQRDRVRDALRRAFATATTTEVEMTVPAGDGGSRTVRNVAAPLTESGSVAAVLLVSSDITEQKEAERRLRDHAKALRQSVRDLRRSNEALARYASLTAHDLREPLRDIVRYLQRIERREMDLDAESRDDLAFVIARARRLDSLVGALHRFAEVDERSLETESVDLEDALAEARALADTEDPPAMDVQTGELITVRADRDAIVEILRHLIENAHQHAGRDPVRVWVDSWEPEEGWCIAVEDDGQGIAPRYHEQVFQPFRPRVADPGSRETRMGLARVRRLVERMGGTISLDSEPGAGARFTFTVPRHPLAADRDDLPGDIEQAERLG
jgi:signal transduction histidine kinase